jgi:2-oxoisovalerate dehydrogenase E1 component
MRSRGTTVYLEPKALYNAKSAMTSVPEDFEVPFGKARIRREGKDLSIITYGNTVHFSLEAAEVLAKEGFDVEVLDLRSLNPLDLDSIVATVKKTHRALVVHEDKVFAGFGGELVGVINEHAFEHLDAPVMRVGSTFTPVGFNRILERATLPDINRILVAARKMIQY